MKNITLRYYPYNLELAHVFTVSGFSRTSTPTVRVELQYDNFIGYGEASMPPYLGETTDSVCGFLSKIPVSLFADPFKTEDILREIDAIAPGNNAAKAAVDIALHDLQGKLLNIPLYKLLGKDPLLIPPTSYTIGIDTPEVMREKTIEAGNRFRVLKVKVGTDNDLENIRCIRSVTDLPLTTDANQGWKDKEIALDLIFALKELGVVMIEQPMPKENIDDIAWLKERSPLPLIADESIKRFADLKGIEHLYHGINIKLMKSTGIHEALKMIDYARLYDMKVMIGCMTETSCAISAAAAIAARADYADLDGALLIKNDFYTGLNLVDGKITLNELPGLGIIRNKRE